MKVVFDNLANFLSIYPNQTIFLSSVCLVPAGLLPFLFQSKQLTQILLDFKVAKWAISSMTHCSNIFEVHMFILRFMIQILHNIPNVREGKRHQKKENQTCKGSKFVW